jgi:hypothetical protein
MNVDIGGVASDGMFLAPYIRCRSPPINSQQVS